jgi:hypothetical protein
VVLATVSHLNDDVYNLTMTDANGNSTTIGVTGYHKIYTEDRGWVDADALVNGELVRSETGDVTVTDLSTDPGTFRVYNMDVEDDHDYYVSDLDALVHNFCGDTQDHHIDPAYLKDGIRSGPTIELPTAVHREVHNLIDAKLFAEFGADAPFTRYAGADAWTRFFNNNPGSQAKALDIARQALVEVLARA